MGSEVDAEEPEYEAKTELGRKLVLLRKEIERSGVPLLDWDDLEREIAERRGAPRIIRPWRTAT